MSAARVVMISNPSSGNNRRDWARVEARLRAHPEVIHHVTGSLQEAADLLPRLAAERPEILVINGGDGTIAAVTGMILDHWPRAAHPLVMVLPGGTANMTAGDIGMATGHAKALARFSRWLEAGAPTHGATRERHVMRVTGAADGAVRHGLFLGTGAVMQATRYAHDNVHSRGLGGEISLGLILVRALWGLMRRDPRFYQPTQVALRVTGRADETAREAGPMLILVASTLARLSLGIRPFWGPPADGAIGLTAIRGGARRFGLSILSVLRGRPNRHVTRANGYESFRGDRIALHLDGEVNLDGELFAATRATPLTITAEGPVRFLRPR